MVCTSCGTENRPGRKFCSQCGTTLSVACASCGAANEPEDRFCGECGAVLEVVGPGVPQAAGRSGAERRLVSVLFADLVGFTALSEHRDSEDVRELLSGYFDTARRIIGRYGGTIEKFIGDAVMAVWGAPVAREDDAERAVRAALDLVGAVTTLGEEVQASGLAARAGVATGEAAVTLGAEGQGMVAGDLVNTASRVQSAAAAETVMVTDVTRWATEAAIVYEDAGAHELKGKAESVTLSRAVRVIALRGGELRSAGLESPFVGRDREFRLLKDLFHATADDRKAHLVSVSGIAGIGKSRLSWEFFKYIDGLVDDVWWHRGRCIAYGDGVTYWALAEMVRMRARILEEEEQASAADKLRRTVAEHVADEEERRFIEPRLAHLLGLEERTAPAREDLFAAWRLFFERLSDEGPVALVFEDLQWADEALLDFIEYLLDWSRNHRLYVVTLARPELAERRPNWGAGRHGFTSLFLEPLPDDAMDELLRGMVPGLPGDLRERIRGRAEGVPLYAVETVRMLLDRGLLRREGSTFELTGPVGELDVPETLQALIAARLDGLPAEERTLLQDASVLGKTFTRSAVAAIGGRSEEELEPVLSSLARKELLVLQADPRSPEHGQYGFLQSLVQKVAYDTLSKKDRKAKHLAAAEHLERTWGADEDEIVEVLASHFLEAYRLAPDAEDAEETRTKARDALDRAGRRAQSLASMQLARGYFERAAELTDDPSERAELKEQAGFVAFAGGRLDDAIALYDEAITLFEAAGMTHAAARVSARIGEALWLQDRPDEAIDRMERALEVLEQETPDHDLAMLSATLGRVLTFGGRSGGMEHIDRALEIAESLWLPDVLSDALNTKGVILDGQGRFEEELGLMKRSLEIALENDVPTAAIRAYSNLSYVMFGRDRYEDALQYQEKGIALARRLGFRGHMWFLTGHVADTKLVRGEWDEVEAVGQEADEEADDPGISAAAEFVLGARLRLAADRGNLDDARRLVERHGGDPEAGDVQTRSYRRLMRAIIRNAEGDHRQALAEARAALENWRWLGLRHDVLKWTFIEALDAALALGDAGAAEEILGIVTGAAPGAVSPFMRAQAERFGARLDALRGFEDGVEQRFKTAAGLFREIGTPFYLACTLLEHGEWLTGTGRPDDAKPLLDEAREIFERLRATPWLERVARLKPDLARA